MASDNEVPIMPFPSGAAWEQWLSENHGAERGLWLQIAKKNSGIASVTYDEALDVALCYGWIDGQRKSHSEDYFLQRFTPRRSGSLWSKRNLLKVAVLIESGKMQPRGFAEIEAAQKDGRWEAAYDSPKDMVVPDDFLEALQGNERAQAFFETLGKTDRFLIGMRLQTAKTPETRKRRSESLITLLERNQRPT